MELSRRDAIAALAVAGVGGSGLAVAHQRGLFDGDSGAGDGGDVDDPLYHTQALAEVLYPSEVTASEEFVETYVGGRIEDDESYEAELLEGLELLNDEAIDHYGEGFTDLSVSDRDDLLHELGLHQTAAQPEGNSLERGRYYLVDELLYALFTSPTGGELVGTENPTGYGGGLDSYQRGEPE